MKFKFGGREFILFVLKKIIINIYLYIYFFAYDKIMVEISYNF